MNEIENIIEKYNVLNDNVGNKKYFHLNSIRNFIIQFDKFASQTEKKTVIDLMNKYFDFIDEKYILDQDEAKKIFYECIQPIGLFYSKRLDFNLYTSPTTYLIFITFAFITFLLLKLHLLFYFGTILILLAFYIPSYLKLKKNKVYGFNF